MRWLRLKAVIWQMMTIFFTWDINVGCSYFRWGERMFVFQCLMGGWWGEYSYRCQPVDYTNSPSANRVSAQNMQTNNEHETHLQYSTLLFPSKHKCLSGKVQCRPCRVFLVSVFFSCTLHELKLFTFLWLWCFFFSDLSLFCRFSCLWMVLRLEVSFHRV